MKKIIVSLVIFLMPMALFTQQNPLERLFSKYAGIQGITSVHISPGMFSVLANIDADNNDLKSLASSVTSLLILHAPGTVVETHSIDFYNEALNDLDHGKYEELMKINTVDQQVLILAHEEGGIIRELIMLSGGKSDNVLICLKGNVDMKKISSLSGINAPGMEHFMNLQE